MTKGGARYTHANLLAADLDFLAIEAQVAQEQLAAGLLTPTEAAWRFGRFSAEVERLARSGSRHLRLMQGGERPITTAALERAA